MNATELADATKTAAERGDIFGVAALLEKRMWRMPHSFADVLEDFPELSGWVSSGVGNDNGRRSGQMSYLPLSYDKTTRAAVVLAAMQVCWAPAHLHVGSPTGPGEVTVSLAGLLIERVCGGGGMAVAVVGAGLSSCARWGPGTIHQPAAPGFWCGV